MDTSGEQVIMHSRRKLVVAVLASLVLLAASVWLVNISAEEAATSRRFSKPAMVYLIGWAGVVLFVILPLYSMRKMFDRRPGLVINSSGLLDNSSAAPAGLIPWPEIRGFGIYQVQKNRMLIIMVTDPEKYVRRGNAVQRALRRSSMGMAGSPLWITSSTLNIGFDELKQMLEAYLQRYGTV